MLHLLSGLWAAFILVSVFWNYYLIKNGGVNHTSQFVIRLLFGLILAGVYFSQAGLLQALYLLGLYGSSFWLFFDLLLNAKRGRAFFYIGKTAWIDKVFYYMPGGVLLMPFLKINLFLFFALKLF